MAGGSAVSDAALDCEKGIVRLECLVKEAHSGGGALMTVTPARLRAMADCLECQVVLCTHVCKQV